MSLHRLKSSFGFRTLISVVLLNILILVTAATAYSALQKSNTATGTKYDELPIQQISKFRLDFRVGNKLVPTGKWWSISGGDAEQKRPGQVYYSDITVKGPFVKDRKAVMDWVNGAAKGKRERVNMDLTVLNDDGQPVVTYTLFHCLPVRYEPPAVSAGNYEPLEESITFHLMKVWKAEEISSGVAATGNPSDEPLFGGNFRVDIDGEIPATSFSGGGVTFDKREVTGGEHPVDLPQYVISKVNWANIVIEKNFVQGDTKWKDWFEAQSTGQAAFKNVTLEYMDSEGKAARRIDFMNAWPIRYDVLNVDPRSGSSSIKEVIELVVGYAQYK